jgi:hypothetical protein
MAAFPPSGAPIWEKWERLADEWPVVEGPDFADGGKDYFSAALTTPIRRWRIRYAGRTVTEAQVLDDWYTANRGSGLTFSFTDRDTVVYGNVRCVSYTRGHDRMYAFTQFREILLEDRP